MIELRKITWDNWEECRGLEVTDEQDDFIASNEYSLAQSYVALLNDELPPMSYAIYNDDKMIGFTMIGSDTTEGDGYEYGNEPSYYIYRFMIDKKYQNQGFGKQAMQKVLEYIKTFPQGEVAAVYLSYNPDNNVARKLYQSFGFIETGEIDDGEVVARLKI